MIYFRFAVGRQVARHTNVYVVFVWLFFFFISLRVTALPVFSPEMRILPRIIEVIYTPRTDRERKRMKKKTGVRTVC